MDVARRAASRTLSRGVPAAHRVPAGLRHSRREQPEVDDRVCRAFCGRLDELCCLEHFPPARRDRPPELRRPQPPERPRPRQPHWTAGAAPGCARRAVHPGRGPPRRRSPSPRPPPAEAPRGRPPGGRGATSAWPRPRRARGGRQGCRADGARREEVLGARLDQGVAVSTAAAGALERARLLTASHPVPDARGLAASAEVESLARGLGRDDLLLVLLSGGASALLPSPAEASPSRTKARTTSLLLRAGRRSRDEPPCASTCRGSRAAASRGRRPRRACDARALRRGRGRPRHDRLGPDGARPHHLR